MKNLYKDFKIVCIYSNGNCTKSIFFKHDLSNANFDIKHRTIILRETDDYDQLMTKFIAKIKEIDPFYRNSNKKVLLKGFRQFERNNFIPFIAKPINFLISDNISFAHYDFWDLVDQKTYNESVDCLTSSKKMLISDENATYNDYQGHKLKTVPFIKSLKYQISLEYNYYLTDHPYTQNTWFNQISLPSKFNISGKLYLGALPVIALDNPKRNYLNAMLNEKITHILSMVEPFEIQLGCSKPFSLNNLKPISVNTWKQLGIKQLLISTSDYLPVSNENIQQGVLFLDEILSKGDNVYVHCKAGRGRSTTIILCYLMSKHGLSYEEAFGLVKQSRQQIYLKKKQIKAVQNFSLSYI